MFSRLSGMRDDGGRRLVRADRLRAGARVQRDGVEGVDFRPALQIALGPIHRLNPVARGRCGVRVVDVLRGAARAGEDPRLTQDALDGGQRRNVPQLPPLPQFARNGLNAMQSDLPLLQVAIGAHHQPPHARRILPPLPTRAAGVAAETGPAEVLKAFSPFGEPCPTARHFLQNVACPVSLQTQPDGFAA